MVRVPGCVCVRESVVCGCGSAGCASVVCVCVWRSGRTRPTSRRRRRRCTRARGGRAAPRAGWRASGRACPPAHMPCACHAQAMHVRGCTRVHTRTERACPPRCPRARSRGARGRWRARAASAATSTSRARLRRHGARVHSRHLHRQLAALTDNGLEDVPLDEGLKRAVDARLGLDNLPRVEASCDGSVRQQAVERLPWTPSQTTAVYVAALYHSSPSC